MLTSCGCDARSEIKHLRGHSEIWFLFVYENLISQRILKSATKVRLHKHPPPPRALSIMAVYSISAWKEEENLPQMHNCVMHFDIIVLVLHWGSTWQKTALSCARCTQQELLQDGTRVFDSHDPLSSFRQRQMNMNQRPGKTSGTREVS